MKTKAHSIYKDKDGVNLVGVTTVTGQLGWSKNVLIKWANNLGLKGIDANRYRDDKADIGTLAHELCLEHYLQGNNVNVADYSKKQIKEAKKSLEKFKEWFKDNNIKPILVEKQLVNGEFGGTPDLYGELHGKKTLIDLKTGKGIYPTHHIQLSAYKALLENNGYDVEKCIILKIPRGNNETFQVVEIFNTDVCFEVFKHMLEVWKLKNSIGN